MSNESRYPKVVATRKESVRHKPEDSANVLRVSLEYAFTYGPYRSAKEECVITEARNEADFSAMVKDDLADKINEKFPGENLRSRDVMLFGF